MHTDENTEFWMLKSGAFLASATATGKKKIPFISKYRGVFAWQKAVALFLRAARLFLCLLPLTAEGQGTDAVQINAWCVRAHRIHEDSSLIARQLCSEIIQASQKVNYAKGQGDACLTLGCIERNEGHFTESYHYLHQSLKIRRELGDSNRVAAVFSNLAINMLEESKYDSAIATVLYGIRIAEASLRPDYTILGSGYLLLSNIYDEYLEPEDALKYAQKSLSSYLNTGNKELIGKAAYALANRHLQKQARDSALLYYDQAYENFMGSSGDLRFTSDIMTNKGLIYTQMGQFSRADHFFKAAEALLNQLGQDADYFHWYLNKGNWFAEQGDWTNAITNFKKALPEQNEEMSYLDQLFLFKNLAVAYAALPLTDSAYYFQSIAYDARDSIFNENKRKEFIRFQTERYKKENAEQVLTTQKQASKARLFLQSSALLFLLLLVIAFAYFQRKKAFNLIQLQKEKLHRQEVDELIRKSELQYLSAGLEGRETERNLMARELHDQLGSTLVMLSWQYDNIRENTDPHSIHYQQLEKLNKSLQQLYAEVRNLSHQLGSGTLQRAGLIPVLTELLNDIETHNRMEISFSHFGMAERLEFNCELNILRIIQELISNVLKYAKATQLMVQINRIDADINIMVEDDGLGFDHKTLLMRSGTGLDNIEARLRSLNGTFQFENRPAGGTTVIINIPVPESDLMPSKLF